MSFIENLEKDYKKLETLGAEKILIGKTVLNRPIYAFAVGCGEPKIIAQYAIHAREYITYYLANLHIIKMLKTLKHGQGTIYFVPIVNIDGVGLVLDGLSSVPNEKQDLLKKLEPNLDFSRWKANIRAVDLNVNFPAKWGLGKSNLRVPNFQNYIGEFSASEPETQCLMNFTKQIKPDLTLSFHSKGEVIYYDFHQKLCVKHKHKQIAKVASRSTGYKIEPTGKSAGGYKDWCIMECNIPALTIEVGQDFLTHPIKIEALPQIWQKNENIMLDLLEFLRKKSIKN